MNHRSFLVTLPILVAMHKWLPNLVAKFWLPNLVLYQTVPWKSRYLKNGRFSFNVMTLKENLPLCFGRMVWFYQNSKQEIKRFTQIYKRYGCDTVTSENEDLFSIKYHYFKNQSFISCHIFIILLWDTCGLVWCFNEIKCVVWANRFLVIFVPKISANF